MKNKSPRIEYNYVYSIIDIRNANMYVGVHSTYNINDNYLGSGVDLPLHLYRRRNILRFFQNRNDALSFESLILSHKWCGCSYTYNKARGSYISGSDSFLYYALVILFNHYNRNHISKLLYDTRLKELQIYHKLNHIININPLPSYQLKQVVLFFKQSLLNLHYNKIHALEERIIDLEEIVFMVIDKYLMHDSILSGIANND